MKFNLIDRESWKRKEHFKYYFSSVPCSYSMTINLDIARLLALIKKHELKLYPVMIYSISRIVNLHEEFRTSTDSDGNIGFFDIINPSYTIFHKDSELFSDMWTEYNADFNKFYQNYLKDMKAFGNVQKFSAKEATKSNLFNISSIPWTTFTGFNLNLEKGYDYLLPIFTMGKFYSENEKILLPLSIQVHHAVCDGFHVGRFVNELQELLNSDTF